MLLGASPKPRDLTHYTKSKPLENEVRGYLSNPCLASRLQRRSSWFPPELYPPLKQVNGTQS